MDFKEIAYSDINTINTLPVITKVETAKRHVVKINNIKAEKRIYAPTSEYETGELISGKTNRLAIFANEIIPEHLRDAALIEYTLTINGKPHKVVPVNSSRAGLKIIKGTSFDFENSYSIVLNEEIKSASLKIKIKSSGGDESPFISNLKILYGE